MFIFQATPTHDVYTAYRQPMERPSFEHHFGEKCKTCFAPLKRKFQILPSVGQRQLDYAFMHEPSHAKPVCRLLIG